ncbi:MAG: putative transrane anti-sigma factor [Dehalococcoidia bacterium]|nr:putative transrane anti-sigma factor [Dehalococcoidia bacterium]
MDCQRVEELLPIYYLGALDGDEAREVEKHLEGCAVCMDQSGHDIWTTQQLVYSIALVEPPRRLREQVLLHVTEVEAGPLPEEEDRAVSSFAKATHSRQMWTGRAAKFAIALLPVLVLVLVFWITQLQTRVGRLENQNSVLAVPIGGESFVMGQLPFNNQGIYRLSPTGAAPQARGFMVASSNGTSGFLFVHGLPPLSSPEAYQLWLIRDGEKSSGGVFSVDDEGYGVVTVTLPDLISSYRAIGIIAGPISDNYDLLGTTVLEGEF